jgi:mercuric ion transport protein
MRDHTLITTGVVGGLIAAVCCATPLLAILFGAIGFTTWLAKADSILMAALIICIALVGVGLYQFRRS